MNSIEDWERTEVVDPFHFRCDGIKLLLLKSPQCWEWLDNPIFNCLEDLARHRVKDIQGELPIVRTLLNQSEARGFAKSGPHLSKLTREDLSKDRSHADIREKVSVFANP